MKFNVMAVAVVVAICGVIFGVEAQINLLSNSITFRSNSTAANGTTHYGDLTLNGGSNGMGWGWLYCNEVHCNSGSYFTGLIQGWNGFSLYGNLNVYNGTKNFIQPHPTDTTKVIKYIAIEAGEATTMARGLSKTSGGSVAVDLPEHFGLVTSADAPLTVLLTPEKAPVLLYTATKSKERITVVMKPADFTEFGDVEFAWQVSGVRDGFENEQIICDRDSLLNGTLDNKPVAGKRAKIKEWGDKLVAKQKEMAGRK